MISYLDYVGMDVTWAREGIGRLLEWEEKLEVKGFLRHAWARHRTGVLLGDFTVALRSLQHVL